MYAKVMTVTQDYRRSRGNNMVPCKLEPKIDIPEKNINKITL